MNSAEEISKYHDHNSHYCSPVLARRTGGTSYDFPEKSPKKDKKWSLGSLFRRKKKPGSESSSEEDAESKNFLHKKKKKSDKRKRTNKTIGFDHVVVPPSSRHPTLSNGYKNHEDPIGVLSEPSYTGRTVSRNFIPASDFTSRLVPLKDSEENGINRSNNSLGSPSVSSLGRRKKEVVKARAAARRDTSKGEESSDEDSQRSAFKSDDSLTKPRDGSLSRRSRAARTQRYLKRRSKDEEGHEPLRACKSDIEHDHARNLRLADERMQNMNSASISPILSTTPKSKLSYTNSAPPSRPNFSGLSTIPPSHSSHSKYRTINVTNGSLHKQSSSFHDYNDTGNKCASADLNNQRSLSCGANIHNAAPSPENVDEVVHVQFPLGRPFNKRPNMVINQHLTPGKRQPPPPPPRDPRRILTVQNSDGRPISYSFENGYQSKNGSDQQLNKPPVTGVNRNFNLNPSCRSTSEDHISLEPSQRIPLVPRPSSATPEANRLHKLGKAYSENSENPNGYRYLTDKNPRSRKPICIQSCTAQVEDVKTNLDQQNKSQKPFDFWKQKDEQVARSNPRKSTPGSPLMFTAQTHVRTNIFLPNGVTVETDPTTMNLSNGLQRESSPFRPITSPKPPSPNTDKAEKISNGSLDEADFIQRKSSNLEDALDELEAIYNSLHLGDEDLLERAEQREAEAAQKRRDAAFESFPNSVSRGALSDSSFGYDPSFEMSRKKRHLRRTEPDRKADDMAFRKLNKERSHTINDPQSNAPRASYLLTSPVFNTPVDDSAPQKEKGKSKEPDVTFDDVVYRNVKHTNNSLKVVDPQPPFGIPIGPILPASNSDYLHATPEVTQRFTFKPKKIPDVVKDDLAYRNLRKDANKEPALPQSNFSHEDYLNNNNKSSETSKKKRAVRSLSANIANLMQRDWKSIDIPDDDSKDQNIGDVADALEIARQILKEKEQKISATRKAFMSDGELKYRKFERSSPTEQRINFLNEMRSSNSLDNENVYHHKLQVSVPVMDYDRLEAKPPTPDRSRRGSRPSTKESTPIPSSPSEEAQIKKQLQQSTLDELLTSLAVQARETSDRITNELKMYEEEKERKHLENGLSFNGGSPEKQKKILIENRNTNGVKVYGEEMDLENGINEEQEKKLSIEKIKELEKDAISASLNLQLTETDSTSEHAKLCEKLLECVVDSTEFLAATKDEQEPSEEVARIHIDPPFPETVANVVLTPSDKSKLEVDPVSTEVFSESDHDYVNIQSNDELEKDVETETDTETAKDTSKGVETENLSGDVRGDSVFEIGSSTEMDEEEKELLIDDDTVSADICMSPLEKHKAELVAAFEELRLKDDSLRKSKRHHNDENVRAIKSIDQTEKGGGEECVSVQYIALPTKGCALPTESRFNFDNLNPEETERYLNVYNFDFDSEAQGEYLNEDRSVDNFGANSEIWINDEDALDSLKSPKLVKNINTVVTENYGKNLEQSCSNCGDSAQIVLGLGKCLEELESSLNLERNNILANTSDSRTSDIDKILDSQAKLDFDALLTSHYDSAQIRRDFRELVDVNYDLDFDRNIDSNQNFPLLNPDDIRTNCELEQFDSAQTSDLAQNSVSLGDDSEESAKARDEGINDSYVNNNLDNRQRSVEDKSKNSESVSSHLRDSRHTLDEMRPSRSWYEDPAVIALACSCGIACTSQLPSFDIIVVLGLLFAIISLFIALMTRT